MTWVLVRLFVMSRAHHVTVGSRVVVQNLRCASFGHLLTSIAVGVHLLARLASVSSGANLTRVLVKAISTLGGHSVSHKQEVRAGGYVNRVALAVRSAHARVILFGFVIALSRISSLIAAARALHLETNLRLSDLLMIDNLAVCLKWLSI